MQHLWIFQLETNVRPGDKEALMAELDAFMQKWKAHGAPVPGTVEMHYDRFLVVRAEPGHATGCSIDAMNKGVSDILGNYALTVLGAENIFFKTDEGKIDYFDFRDARVSIMTGKVHAKSVVFDSSLGQSSNLEKWEQPLESTWLGRFLPQQA